MGVSTSPVWSPLRRVHGRTTGDASGRWFRDGGLNKFVDVDGEVLEGRAAWRASEKQKKTVAANGRARR